METTFALVLLLTFSDSAATADKSQLNVLDTGLTREDCLARISPAVTIHRDSFVVVTSETRCEVEPIK